MTASYHLKSGSQDKAIRVQGDITLAFCTLSFHRREYREGTYQTNFSLCPFWLPFAICSREYSGDILAANIPLKGNNQDEVFRVQGDITYSSLLLCAQSSHGGNTKETLCPLWLSITDKECGGSIAASLWLICLHTLLISQ